MFKDFFLFIFLVPPSVSLFLYCTGCTVSLYNYSHLEFLGTIPATIEASIIVLADMTTHAILEF